MEVAMSRAFPILVIVMVCMALPVVAGEKYGDGVSLDEPVAIPTLLNHPDDYLGKTVRVDGVITGVCKKRGCWMQVTGPDTGEGVRIKVEDGVIVFPYTAMGHRVSAEGVFEAIPVEEPAAEGAAHQHAEGEECDRAEGSSKTGCDAPVENRVVYLIRGTGAVIS
jgi:hypothetical protein